MTPNEHDESEPLDTPVPPLGADGDRDAEDAQVEPVIDPAHIDAAVDRYKKGHQAGTVHASVDRLSNYPFPGGE